MPTETDTFAPAVMPAGSSAPPCDGELLRGVTAQLRSLAESHSRGTAELGTRLARVEEDLQTGLGRSRSLTGLAAATALVAFLATSLVWQLGHRTAAIDRGLKEMTAFASRSASATDAALARIDGRLARESAQVDRIETALATVQSAGERALAALDGLDEEARSQVEVTGRISRQLTEAALEVAGLRRDVDLRFTREQDLAAADRAELLRSMTAAIGRVEREMVDQAAGLRVQKEQLDATSRRLVDTRRQMLAEATVAVGAQLEGLREILAGLRAETETVVDGAAGTVAAPAGEAAVAAAEPATTDADVDTAAAVAAQGDVGEEPVSGDAESGADESAASAEADPASSATDPLVATRPDDTVVE